MEERRGERHRAHQPAQVGEPEQPIPLAHVHAVAEVVRGLDQEPAVGEHRALGASRRARGVDDEARPIGLDRERRSPVALSGHRVVPPAVASGRPRDLPAEPPVDEHGGDRRALGHGLVGRLLHRHDLAAPVEAVRRDQQPGLAVGQPRGDGAGPEAREARRVDGADPRDGQRGDGGLRRHRQEDADPVSLAHSQRLQRVGQAVDLARELGVGERARLAVVALPGDGRPGAAAGIQVAVDAVVGEVQTAAWEPLRPGHPAGAVQHSRVRCRPPHTQVAHHGVPVPLQVADRAALQLGQGRDAVGAHEARDP